LYHFIPQQQACMGDAAMDGAGPQLKRKGRGHREVQDMEARYGRARFSELKPNTGPGPTPSIEGWVVIVTGIHEEAQVTNCRSGCYLALL
jgi:hypothetical protein